MTSYVCRSQLSMRPVDDRQAVQVRVNDDVGHIAMDKELSRLQPNDLVCGNTAVRASDPQVVRLLCPGQSRKEVGVPGTDRRGPTKQKSLATIYSPTVKRQYHRRSKALTSVLGVSLLIKQEPPIVGRLRAPSPRLPEVFPVQCIARTASTVKLKPPRTLAIRRPVRLLSA